MKEVAVTVDPVTLEVPFDGGYKLISVRTTQASGTTRTGTISN